MAKREKPQWVKNFILKRKSKGWKAKQLAEQARIPYPTLRDIESGKSGGLEINKQAIAKALGWSMAEMYSGESIFGTTIADIKMAIDESVRDVIESKLPKDEEKLLRLYRQADETGKMNAISGLKSHISRLSAPRPRKPRSSG